MKRRQIGTLLGFCILAGTMAAPARAQSEKRAVRLNVDLREAPKRIFHAQMEFSVAPGPLTLVYPEWIPGEHSPNGPIADLTGLKFRAGDKEIPWRRDSVDMFAFHCEIPAGVSRLQVSLDYLSPTSATSTSAKPSATSQMAVLNWYMVVLYPQGMKTDDLTYSATLRLPAGWKFGTALPVAKETPDGIEFQPATLTRLVDSPVITGAYLKTIELTKGQQPEHRIHIAADGPADIEATPEQVQHWKQLVAETGKLCESSACEPHMRIKQHIGGF
jgi:predicted metalloprotease with PDZ domain